MNPGELELIWWDIWQQSTGWGTLFSAIPNIRSGKHSNVIWIILIIIQKQNEQTNKQLKVYLRELELFFPWILSILWTYVLEFCVIKIRASEFSAFARKLIFCKVRGQKSAKTIDIFLFRSAASGAFVCVQFEFIKRPILNTLLLSATTSSMNQPLHKHWQNQWFVWPNQKASFLELYSVQYIFRHVASVLWDCEWKESA